MNEQDKRELPKATSSADEKGTDVEPTPRASLQSAMLQRKIADRLQRRASGDTTRGADPHAVAEEGISGASQPLPHLDTIQKSFGAHDVGHVKAHVGGAATDASERLGATAYATGDSVAFRKQPDLHTAAHEAAHVVQQRAGVHLKGGVGEEGDGYERHADAVADVVTQGKSAEGLLDRMAGPDRDGGAQGRGAIQAKALQLDDDKDTNKTTEKTGDKTTEKVEKTSEKASEKTTEKSTEKTTEKSTEKTPETGTEKAPGGTSAPALANDELILTVDPKFADAKYVKWFQDKVKAKVEAWGLTFDAGAVRCDTVEIDGKATRAVLLKWPGDWGTRPITRDIAFSMGPIDARAAVAGVKKLKGWAKVEAGDQGIIDALLGGETNDVSSAARNHLRPLYAGLKSKPEDDQASALKGVITAKDATPAVVAETVETTATKYTCDGPKEKKDYQFKGKKADAEEWTVKFEDGTQLAIIAPKAPETGYHNHSVKEAAEAASYLPKSARQAINTVLLNVVVNPDDAHWAVEYKRPDFHSYMTAGAAGVVTIYPNKTEKAMPSANYMRGTMIHETGHAWSYQKWGDDKTKGKWAEWKVAMDKDKVAVSDYAKASISEDVAETIQVFGSTMGKPKYDEYKKMVPARFEILEKEYK